MDVDVATEVFGKDEVAHDDSCGEDSEESEDSEDSEPKLKYDRMKNDLENIFSKHAASCIAVHPKFMILGNDWGMIHLLDHQGNTVLEKLCLHRLAVNQISIDSNGDYIASCSDDGRVFISGLYSSENNQEFKKENAKVRSIAIDPSYYKQGSGRRFLTGDDQLVLHEKTFLARLKSTSLAKAEGTVHNIKWNGQFVAWADNMGVWLYDVNARCSLGLLKWPRSSEAPPENYRCNLFWKDSTTLLIGWVNSVRVCVLRKRTPQELANGRDLPETIVDPVSVFETDFYISGIAPLNGLLVILGLKKELEKDGTSPRPIVYVIEPHFNSYTELCTDSLSLRGFQHLTCNHYHLDCLIEENTFFIVSPKDVVVASPYDADDRIKWLIKNSKFEVAMEAFTNIEGVQPQKFTLLQVGQAYLSHLLEQEQFEKAGELCQRILGNDKRLWEEEVFKFARIHQLRAVSPFLPLGANRLDPTIYEMVLYEFLKMDTEGFVALMKKWSPDLYSVEAVRNAMLEHCIENEADKAILWEAFAILYTHAKQYEKALAIYLKLPNKDVFELIHKHKLYSAIHDMIEQLVELDEDQAISLFLEKEQKSPISPAEYRVPPDIVVEKLARKPYYQYLYLDALDRKDGKAAGRKYHGLLVKLYANFDRKKLLPLLKRSDLYPIRESLTICQELCYTDEMVYLLDRIGNHKDALSLIIEKLGSIEQALDFCKEHNDTELWEDLINYSLKKSEFITFLLQHIGTYIDPLILVQRIENGKEIPGLKNSLVKLMRDYSLQVSVQEGFRKILTSDYFNLHDRLVSVQQRGILFDDDQLCGKCGKIIVRNLTRIVFFCKHAFHEECLPSKDILENCIICNTQKNSI